MARISWESMALLRRQNLRGKVFPPRLRTLRFLNWYYLFPFLWQISSNLIKTKYSVSANVYSTSEEKTLSSRFHDKISYPGRSQPNASVCIRIWLCLPVLQGLRCLTACFVEIFECFSVLSFFFVSVSIVLAMLQVADVDRRHEPQCWEE
jgi:hypothetical protein